MREAKNWPSKACEYVEVGSFGGERKGQRSQRCLAVESGAPQTRAGQKVGDGFQVARSIAGCEKNLQSTRPKELDARICGTSQKNWLQLAVACWRQNRKCVWNDRYIGGNCA
jgi:hypothetical protein